MVLTSITNAEVAGKESRELTDEDVLGVLTSESKKRREAAEAFADAGREEQAAKEKAEAAVIADYLPEQLSAEEIDALVDRDHRRARRPRRRHAAMGRVMGVLTPKTKGRADGGAVAAAVRRAAGQPEAQRPWPTVAAVAVPAVAVRPPCLRSPAAVTVLLGGAGRLGRHVGPGLGRGSAGVNVVVGNAGPAPAHREGPHRSGHGRAVRHVDVAPADRLAVQRDRVPVLLAPAIIAAVASAGV